MIWFDIDDMLITAGGIFNLSSEIKSKHLVLYENIHIEQKIEESPENPWILMIHNSGENSL